MILSSHALHVRYTPSCYLLWTHINSVLLYYFSNHVLGISTGLHDVGKIRWQLVLSLMGAWALVAGCLIKGIHSQGKVSMYGPFLLEHVLLYRIHMFTRIYAYVHVFVLCFLVKEFPSPLSLLYLFLSLFLYISLSSVFLSISFSRCLFSSRALSLLPSYLSPLLSSPSLSVFLLLMGLHVLCIL